MSAHVTMTSGTTAMGPFLCTYCALREGGGTVSGSWVLVLLLVPVEDSSPGEEGSGDAFSFLLRVPLFQTMTRGTSSPASA